MDPLSIISASVGLASVIAKVSVTLTSFVRDARDATKDVDAISAELRAISGVLVLLGQNLPPASAKSPISEALLCQIDVNLSGTTTVVEQIEEILHKYQSTKISHKINWAMYGQGDMRKIRESLEHYKMALGLGLHAVLLSLNQAIKEDSSALLEVAAAIKMNTDDILARVGSLRREGPANKHKRVEDWIEDMTVLSSYAETNYQGTIIDPADMDDISDSTSHLDPVLPPSPRGPSPDHPQHTVAGRPREPDPMGPSTQHAPSHEFFSAPSSSTAGSLTTVPSGISDKPTSALTQNSEDIDSTTNDNSNQLSLFGWRQSPFEIPPDFSKSLVFRTALKSFEYSEKFRVPGAQPLPPHHHCEISLLEWFPTPEALAMANPPSFIFFSVTWSPNVSETPPSHDSILFSIPGPGRYSGDQPKTEDEEVILTFFDTKSLQEFRSHLMGSSSPDGTRQEFALAWYNALKHGGLGTSTRTVQPIDRRWETTPTWHSVSLFGPSASEPPHRLVFESQDGLTFLNNRVGPQYHRFIRLGCTKAHECLLEMKQSLMSGFRSNFLMVTGSPASANPGSISGKELQSMHPDQQVYCQFQFGNLSLLHRFQRAMTGYTVLFDGWPREIMFGRQNVGFVKLPKEFHYGHMAKKPRVQVLQHTGSGAVRVAIFAPPSRRHPVPSQTNFEISKKRNRFCYSRSNSDYSVGLSDDLLQLPSDTLDEWTGVSPNEGNLLDLDMGGGEEGKSKQLFFYFKEEEEGDKLVAILMSLGIRVRGAGS